MNKDIKSIIGITAVCFAAMASCKKSSNPSASANIEGTWVVSKEYQDTNRNGIMDANELITDTAFAYSIMTFNANGTFILTYHTATQQGTWALTNNNTYLVTTDSNGVGGADTTYYDIVQTLTSTSLVIKDTIHAATGGTTWVYFTRQ